MDPETLFNLYMEMSGHIDVINRELGAVGARLDWVEWWIKAAVCGALANAAVGIGNFWLSYRNNKRNNK